MTERSRLTPRQRQIVGLLMDGHGTAQIAAELHLSRNAVYDHVSNIYAQFGLQGGSVHGFLARCLQAGLLKWTIRLD